MNAPVRAPAGPRAHDADAIASLAASCLTLELETWPKPGLVSSVDTGSHADMDAGLFRASGAALRPYFAAIAAAGSSGAPMTELRRIGLAAEAAMLAATGGINTHKGAIFGLGLLCAAAGRGPARRPLGAIVRTAWGEAILAAPPPPQTHGTLAARLYGAGGARAEAAAGFPSLYGTALPALREGRRLRPDDPAAARVHACLALVADVVDTNLLHRGGPAGLGFARATAGRFIAEGGIAQPDWRSRAAQIHRDFVARRLSPGGSADLLAMALFVDAIEPCPPAP